MTGPGVLFPSIQPVPDAFQRKGVSSVTENELSPKNALRPCSLPMNITLLDLSAYLGLIAVAAVTLNMLLGIMMAFRYSPVRSWPHRRFNYFALHNWTGYLALFFAAVHPLVLLLNKSPRFRLLDVFYPVHSPQQPLENTLGAVALYVVAFMVVTSYFRIRLGRHLWKSFHFTVYLGAIALFWHSLFTDPNLNHSPVDWLDGGKVFVAGSALVIVLASLLRFRHSRKKSRVVAQPSRQPATG
ncbi:MAG TPA: ferric reductase-like transmembrane domain-containing protein [Candidatus Methylomirabilis sp.]|nr:ferric reductase-like transmembrane domain-containing protein [Candidatus Methylomirabilis sp.]